MKIVFDIGGSKMRVAKSLDNNTLTKTIVVRTPKNFTKGYEKLTELISELAGKKSITAIAGGFAGTFDTAKTQLVFATNLSDWSNQILLANLRRAFRCPVKLDNDAALGALGEACFGAGKNLAAVAYITIGTGIGGAWVINGKLINSGYNSEPGQQHLQYNKPQTWEQFIKGSHRSKRAQYLVIGLANTLMHWPSDILVLGGGGSLHGNWNLKKIQSELSKLLPFYPKPPQVALAKLGDKSALFGALQLLRQY
ncbi:MAG TPA: ROK family protein [Candidatus Doudnabacteria bacterium]|nr:ROK family protein [Candidatus Doudnabacteria bacterium]